MKKKVSTSSIILLVLGTCLLVFLVIGFSTNWSFLKSEPKFTITREVCEEQFWESGAYSLEPNRPVRLDQLEIPEDYFKNSEPSGDINPLRFRFRDYLDNTICREVFLREGINADYTSSDGYDIPDTIEDIYQGEQSLYGITCRGIISRDEGKYIGKELLERKLGDIIVKIPEFNYSLIEFKRWDDSFEHYASLENKNDYWDAEFTIRSPEPIKFCNPKEVDEIEICHEEGDWCPKETGICIGVPRCECPLFLETISKQDLTPEWLDENAECVNGGLYLFTCRLDGTFQRDINKTPPYEDCIYSGELKDGKRCSQYKYENYTITKI